MEVKNLTIDEYAESIFNDLKDKNAEKYYGDTFWKELREKRGIEFEYRVLHSLCKKIIAEGEKIEQTKN